MNKNLTFFFSLFLALAFFLPRAWGADLSGIDFPIVELGGCQSEEDCEAYCDQSENMAVCLDFAEAHGLLESEEIQMARKMLELGLTGGPGGCQGQIECEAYCDNLDHLNECLEFALEYDLIPPEELEDAKKVAVAIKKGIQPPPCQGQTECDAYCSEPAHMEVCLTFAEAAGMIPPEELEEARMMLEAIKRGAVPPNCHGKEECDIYCEQEDHFMECLTFAEAAGFLSSEEAEMARLTGGKGPGGCRGEAECEAFCQDENNFEECIDFAVLIGEMSAEEAEEAKKTGGRGPGGCNSEAECQAFCEDEANFDECLDFQVMIGDITPEQAEEKRRGGPGNCRTQEECQAFCEDEANFDECLDFQVQNGDISAQEAQQMREMKSMEEAYDPEMMQQEMMQQEMMQQEMMQQGPQEIMDLPQEMIQDMGQEMMQQEMMWQETEEQEIIEQKTIEPSQEAMPSQEIIEEIQEEIIEETIEEIIEETIPVLPEAEPQSLFKGAKRFLAALFVFLPF